MRTTPLFSNRHRAWFGPWSLVIVAFALASTLPAPIRHSSAATPTALPGPICGNPEIVPLRSVSERDSTPLATAIASPNATPIAEETVAEDPNQIISEQIERTLQSIALCQSAGRVTTLAKYVTANFLGDLYAGGGRITKEQFIVLGRELPRIPVEIVSVSDVKQITPDRATAKVVWTNSRQLLHAKWDFVFQPQVGGDQTGEDGASGYWLADGVTQLALEPPVDANVTKVTLSDNLYKPTNIKVTGPDLVLIANNKGDVDHELLVLKLGDSVTTSSLLLDTGAALPDGVTFIGQLTIPAGKQGQLVLIGVDKGIYAVVDLLPDENGTPHLALGMEAILTVR